MAEHDEASRPVVFVSHARDDEGLQAMALLEVALDVGYVVSAGRPAVKSWAHGEADPLQHAEAAVVVVSPAALDSASVRAAVQGLEARLSADPGFRLVALPTMSVDPNVLPGSPLAALAGHDVPPGPSLDWRVQQVLWRLNGGEGHAKDVPPDAADSAADRGATVAPDERAEWISDAPAPEDLLERGSLVRQLATRLERLRAEEPGDSFLIHVDGPWGSGKSTLLRFLARELGDDWLVVRFDAWRQMRVGPPWWALLASLRRTLSDDCSSRFARARLRIAETWQRAPRLVVSSAVMLAALLAGLVVFGLDLGGTKEVAGSLAVLVATATALFGAATAVSRFWLWESAVGARVYEQSHRDPMESLVDHFGWLIARAGKPVVFFVDDLDRCSTEYVVDLLDSVQTLIRDAAARPRAGRTLGTQRGAYVVVCADGRWIRNSYEQTHERSVAAVGEPGRPLGYLFLDKIFQLTFEVPTISRQRQDEYLRRLLRSAQDAGGSRTELAAEREEIAECVDRSMSVGEAVAAHQRASAPVRAALAGMLVDKLAEPQLEHATEHALRKFAPLLEPNPRAMKRFVNAFGLARALQIVQDTVVHPDQLALWTILRSRWPALAEYLRERPELIDALVVGRAPDAIPDGLAPLFVSAEVSRVIRFEHGGPLTAASIRACSGAFEGEDEPAESRRPDVA